MTLTIILLIMPLIPIIAALLIRKPQALWRLLFSSLLVNAGLSIALALPILRTAPALESIEPGAFLGLDGISAFLLIIQSFVALAAGVNLKKLISSEKNLTRNRLKVILILGFLISLNGALTSNHIGLYWVFLETSTLISAPLIFLTGSGSSLEATWKYLFLCSIGISMAFMGITFISMGLPQDSTLDFAGLMARPEIINPMMMKLAFAFILVGIGTKAGLAPMHSWLPDAYSEAAPAVSAFLSGVLLNAALLGLCRFTLLGFATGGQSWICPALLTVSIASLLVTAAYVFRVVNYKRMLAYSSVENAGIVAAALAFGKAGIPAVLIHMAGHSLSKGAIFLTTSWIHRSYGSTNIRSVQGMLERAPGAAWVWLLSFLGLSGFPPFPSFFSKLLILFLAAGAGKWFFMTLFLVLVITATAAMGRNVISMCMGRDDSEGEKEPAEENLAAEAEEWIPQALLLAMGALVCLVLPMPVYRLLLALVQSL